MTMVNNSIISFERGELCVLSFERFLDDDEENGRLDDFLGT